MLVIRWGEGFHLSSKVLGRDQTIPINSNVAFKRWRRVGETPRRLSVFSKSKYTPTMSERQKVRNVLLSWELITDRIFRMDLIFLNCRFARKTLDERWFVFFLVVKCVLRYQSSFYPCVWISSWNLRPHMRPRCMHSSLLSAFNFQFIDASMHLPFYLLQISAHKWTIESI